MSMHAGSVVIEGFHRNDADEIFQKGNYQLTGKPKLLRTNAELEDEMKVVFFDGTKVKKFVYEYKDWTHIVDFELVLFDETQLWQDLSRQWNTRIVCWICEGTSGTYAFSLYSKGELVRQFVYTDGEVSLEAGEPLPEEEDLNCKNLFEDDILRLVSKFGAEGSSGEDLDYYVHILDESHLL